MLSSSSQSLASLWCLEVGTTSAGSSGRKLLDIVKREGQIDGFKDGYVVRLRVEWLDCRLRATCVLHSMGDYTCVQTSKCQIYQA